MKRITVEVLYFGPDRSGKTANIEHIKQNMSALQSTAGQQLSPALLARSGQSGKSVQRSHAAQYEDGLRSYTFIPPGITAPKGKRLEFKLLEFAEHEISWDSEIVERALKHVTGIVFVADSSPSAEKANLDAIEWLNERMHNCGRDLGDTPLVLQYNKRDLADAMPSAEMDQVVNFCGAPKFEAVASEGFGVLGSFNEITKLCLKSLHWNE